MKICSADDKKNRRYYSDRESNQTPPYTPIFGRTPIQDSVLRSFIHLGGEWEKVGDISRLQQQQRGSISQWKETDDLQFHKSSPVGTGLDQPHPKGPELQRSQVHKMAYRQSFCFLSCMRQTIQFLPSVKLEGPASSNASSNEDRLAEREGGRGWKGTFIFARCGGGCAASPPPSRSSVRSVGGNDGRIAPFAGKKWTASSN